SQCARCFRPAPVIERGLQKSACRLWFSSEFPRRNDLKKRIYIQQAIGRRESTVDEVTRPPNLVATATHSLVYHSLSPDDRPGGEI
ncbi:MAG: hypothetical protein KDA96_23025, partial [Planctomycetaceae bacterium]|nr:hypothetical protein [Planctomycetaceae bacterium]